MSTAVFPQLQEVEADLAAQEEALTAQLSTIQGKLEALRAVLPLFDENSSSDTAVPEVESTSPAAVTVSPKAEPAKAEPAKAKSAKKTKASGKKKKDGRAASWQKYTRKGVGEHPIPEAVRLILATQPDKDFKIVEVMNALFEEKMPKSQYLKARNRISNVLSGGVRNGEWYKGERGAYRLTAAS